MVDTSVPQTVDDTHSEVAAARSRAASRQSSHNSVHNSAHWEANIAAAVEMDSKDPHKRADSEEEALEEEPSSWCQYEERDHVVDGDER